MKDFNFFKNSILGGSSHIDEMTKEVNTSFQFCNLAEQFKSLLQKLVLTKRVTWMQPCSKFMHNFDIIEIDAFKNNYERYEAK